MLSDLISRAKVVIPALVAAIHKHKKSNQELIAFGSIQAALIDRQTAYTTQLEASVGDLTSQLDNANQQMLAALANDKADADTIQAQVDSIAALKESVASVEAQTISLTEQVKAAQEAVAVAEAKLSQLNADDSDLESVLKEADSVLAQSEEGV